MYLPFFVAALLVAGCATPSPSTPAGPTGGRATAPAPASPAAPAPRRQATAPTPPAAPTQTARPASGGAACVHGTWRLDAESAYSQENLRRLGLGAGADLRYAGGEGEARLTFEPGGTFFWTLDAFAATMRSRQPAMDVTVRMDGCLTGTYTASGSTLAMRLAGPGVPAPRLASSAEIVMPGMGSMGRQPLGVDRMFRDERWSSEATCAARTLTLVTRGEAGGVLQNARYDRVR